MYSPYESELELKKNCKDNWEKEITQVINICSKRVVHGLNVWDINDLNLGIVITVIVHGCTATIDDGNTQSDAKDRYKRHRAIGCE
ncbi:hypothetical protein Golob_023221 [Gossypium lobatum]|uniref:Uncharacterized protein n=1 Tax=Gossypium lobatum TaxID=34289 RepID=A0A7J8LJ39_9ROSI|nr:hypothetical protein [Gossypium lobatum]